MGPESKRFDVQVWATVSWFVTDTVVSTAMTKVDGTKAKSRIARTAIFGTVVAGAAVVAVGAAVVRGAVTGGGAGFVEVGDADRDPAVFVEDVGTAVEPTVGRAETFRGLGLMVVDVADALAERVLGGTSIDGAPL